MKADPRNRKNGDSNKDNGDENEATFPIEREERIITETPDSIEGDDDLVPGHGE